MCNLDGINDLVESCIEKYDMYFTIQKDSYVKETKLIFDDSTEYLEENHEHFLDVITPNIDSMSCGCLFTYNSYIASTRYNGALNVYEQQSRYRPQIVHPFRVMDLFNKSTRDETLLKYILMEWLTNPEGNIAIEGEIFNRIFSQAPKNLSKTTRMEKSTKYCLVCPPVSKDLTLNENVIHNAISKYAPDGMEVEVRGYSKLISNLDKNELCYVVINPGGDESKYLIVASYELYRNNVICNGILVFDLDTGGAQPIELQELNLNFVISNKENQNKPKDINRKQEIKYVPKWECREPEASQDIKYLSFLSTHTKDFYLREYISKESATILNKQIDRGYSLSPCRLFANVFGVGKISQIPLLDMVWVSDELEKESNMIPSESIARGKSLATIRDIETQEDFQSVWKIPSNYADAQWRLDDDSIVALDYWNLPESFSYDDFIYAYLKQNPNATTEEIAEDILYEFKEQEDVYPTCYFTACMFLRLSKMDNIHLKVISNLVSDSITKVEVSEFRRVIGNVNYSGRAQSVKYISRSKYCNVKISDFGLSVRTFNCLHRAGIKTLKDLERYPTTSQLLRVRNLGKKSARELKEKILKIGFYFD